VVVLLLLLRGGLTGDHQDPLGGLVVRGVGAGGGGLV